MENAGRQVENDELATALTKAEGLGTAATRADIIENLKAREYVMPNLRPTVKGIRLVDVLHRIGASRLTSAELTAKLELHLSEVEQDSRTREEFMKEVEEYVQDVVVSTRDFDFEDIYKETPALGQCPKCQRPVYERAWFYGCDESIKRTGTKTCDFLLWKDHNGRYINQKVVKDLLKYGKTDELDGFYNANGDLYKAVLSLDGGTLVRTPVEGSAERPELVNLEINEEPLCSCPVHQGTGCQIVETASEFICQTKSKGKTEGESGKDVAGTSCPRILCKREMKRDEVLPLFANGETAMLSGFISKRGRRFSAKLKLAKDGSFSFEFPVRGSKKTEGGDEQPSSDSDAGVAEN